jgi:hypothetical protein
VRRLPQPLCVRRSSRRHGVAPRGRARRLTRAPRACGRARSAALGEHQPGRLHLHKLLGAPRASGCAQRHLPRPPAPHPRAPR